MPFDWLTPSPRPSAAARHRAARRASYIAEIRERAGLFRRLGHPVGHARARLLANLTWDFELAGPAPVSEAELEAIVGEAYGAEAPASGADWPIGV